MFSPRGQARSCLANVVEDNLNPVWDPQCFALDAFCGNDLDAVIRILVLDKGEVDAHLL